VGPKGPRLTSVLDERPFLAALILSLWPISGVDQQAEERSMGFGLITDPNVRENPGDHRSGLLPYRRQHSCRRSLQRSGGQSPGPPPTTLVTPFSYETSAWPRPPPARPIGDQLQATCRLMDRWLVGETRGPLLYWYCRLHAVPRCRWGCLRAGAPERNPGCQWQPPCRCRAGMPGILVLSFRWQP